MDMQPDVRTKQDQEMRASELKTIDFHGLEIAWDPRVLEPRPWTSAQAVWAAELASNAPEGPILELCCGAGQIGLLAAKLSRRSLVQVDCDPVAGQFAQQNADRAGIVTDIRIAPMDRALESSESFPIVVADPPWLPTALVSTFPEDPVPAVDGGADGLTLIAMAAKVALDHLDRSGHLVLQVGTDEQANFLAEYLDQPAGTGSDQRAVIATRRCSGGVLVHIAGG